MSLFRRPQPIKCFYCQSTIASSSSSPNFGSSSSALNSFDPNQFRCPHCGCWNRYDSQGDIIGYEPAMHDERLNVESFSKRGSPDRNHLLSIYGNNNSRFFCHTCQTNQTLLVNLLSNYLPSPNDPSYSSRMSSLPEYTASLQLRYPPVCASCLPAVEEEIKRKDEMARTRALAGALRASKPRDTLGKTIAANQMAKKAKLKSWRIRGVLWVANLLVVVIGYALAVFDYRIFPIPTKFVVLYPVIVIASLLWNFWDPTYSLQKRSNIQGRQVRVEGRKPYIVLQSLSWISRLITSLVLFCRWYNVEWDILVVEPFKTIDKTRRQLFFGTALALELTILLLSYFSITIHKPAPIRLIDTSASRGLTPFPESAPPSGTNAAFSRAQTPASPPPHSVTSLALPEPDLFATLSLSSNPIITNYASSAVANPMFGKPSFNSRSMESPWSEDKGPSLRLPTKPSRQNRLNSFDDGDDDHNYEGDQSRDKDAMDWEPLSPKVQRVQNNPPRATTDDGTWLRQQRFFPPEEPTGLEGLLMRTRLVDEDENATAVSNVQRSSKQELPRWHWGWVYSASALPVLILVAALWINSRTRS